MQAPCRPEPPWASAGAGAQQHSDAGLKTVREAVQQLGVDQAAEKPSAPARQVSHRPNRRAGSTEIVPEGPPDGPEPGKYGRRKDRRAAAAGSEDEPSSLYLWGIGAAVLVGAVSVAGMLLSGSRTRPAKLKR